MGAVLPSPTLFTLPSQARVAHTIEFDNVAEHHPVVLRRGGYPDGG